MKRIKKISLVLVFTIIFGISFSTKVYAALNAAVSIACSSGNNVTVGDEFTVNINVTNISRR